MLQFTDIRSQFTKRDQNICLLDITERVIANQSNGSSFFLDGEEKADFNGQSNSSQNFDHFHQKTQSN